MTCRWVLGLCLTVVPLAALGQDAPIPAPSESPRPESRPAEGPPPNQGDPEDRAEGLEPELSFPDSVTEGAEPVEGAGIEPPEPSEPAEPPVYEALREAPGDLSACLAALRDLGAEFTEIEPITEDDRDCGIANPLSVAEILPGIALNPDAVLRCETALAMADWMQDFVLPATDVLTDRGPITAIQHGTTYQCRRRNNAATGKLSEHAFGNGVDVMGFDFENGPSLMIEPRADAGTREEAFQRAVRGTACLEFTTVLGPGSDAAHANHLHFDVKQRRGGYRLCQ